MIGNVTIGWKFEHNNVARFSHIETSHLFFTTDSSSPVDREGSDDLFRAHSHVDGGKGKNKGNRF
jgi:hypothetical protein